MVGAERARSQIRFDALSLANSLFVLAIVLHAGDHFAQPGGLGRLNWAVLWGGSLLGLIGISSCTVKSRPSRAASLQ